MRVLILGGTGMLGHKLCQLLPQYGHEVIGALRSETVPGPCLAAVFPRVTLVGGFDALDDCSLADLVKKICPDVVINAIGVVKQLKEASNRYLSVALNAFLPHRLARLCAEHNARLIHISTDCVFDGTRGSYEESDPPDARDLYGQSKALGETDESEVAAVTLRTSIIGRELRAPTHGLMEWFLRQGGKAIRGYARAIYSGFTTIELARIIALVIEKHPGLHGTYHVASRPISKLDLLALARDMYGLDVVIERDDAFVCDRSLVMRRFSEVTDYTPPSWPEMIRQMRDDPTPYESIQASFGQ
jgi:dTDP-4-dehydrorhamnose reductase